MGKMVTLSNTNIRRDLKLYGLSQAHNRDKKHPTNAPHK